VPVAVVELELATLWFPICGKDTIVIDVDEMVSISTSPELSSLRYISQKGQFSM
jgi:hypothetical protein